MKKFTILSAAVILICSFLVPITSFASTTKAKAHAKAVAACRDKNAGDSVEFVNKAGKRIMGICQEEKGVLVAVPAAK